MNFLINKFSSVESINFPLLFVITKCLFHGPITSEDPVEFLLHGSTLSTLGDSLDLEVVPQSLWRCDA